MEQTDELRVAVAAMILNDDNQVLLQHRKDVEKWGVLSGHVEMGETVSEAMIREAKEEANIDIQIDHLIGVYSEPESQTFKYPDGKVEQFVTIYFLATITGGTLKSNPDESLAFQYFDVNELPTPLLNMHPKWLEDALALKKEAFIR
ncbi:DNA mismatch repair protein MutT [Staphylococcus felis]|uniref:NUDIX domain-containing protein n=1 Tax=Staphylococcus felis TaxID=46127 RepID=A0ABS0QQL8_9STAP|nr:NUDIX domain-containing protein [Staphylococcus felis]MBH9581566.1 NUDIX domain-containing protein [Staphylococcus felis]MDM8326908.1 NUDIX domain-containing protein [Staphylococcus felis]MDQ7192084.1 NUDIX domain-containing protein [Staphylococcus felis]REH90465.1 DNA mismatch repair protein MutT [Staphylococcus felis]